MMQKYLGHIFEVGFNIGILAYIKQHKIKHNFAELYQQDLEHLDLEKMLNQLIQTPDFDESIISRKKNVEKWLMYFLHKGFLSGLNFWGEYVKSLGGKPSQLTILYYQCSFVGENSLKTHPKSEIQSAKDVLSQLLPADKIDDSLLRDYRKEGEFLNADTLMLLQYGKNLRIFCVDLSAFTPRVDDDLADIETMRKLLIKDISYLRAKSVFANLRIDTSTFGVNLSAELKDYLTAFKYNDKEDFKLIQAGSYTDSFYGFLLAQGIINHDDDVLFNVVGYTDRALNTLCLRKENLDLLKTCAEIYKFKEQTSPDINQARSRVLNTIKENAKYSFPKGNDFITSIFEIKPDTENSPIIYTEKIDDFANSIGTISDELATKLDLTPGLELRKSHGELIRKYLNSDQTYLFLTGNPGIGKTTAIASFLKEHGIEDGFLLFYASPRKQVNLDILEKFKDPNTGLLCDDRVFCLYTNANIINTNNGNYTVKYLTNTKEEDFCEKTVHFWAEDRENREITRQEYRQTKVERKNDYTIKPTKTKTKGVLQTISQAIYALINTQSSNHIVATVCLQSLKKNEKEKEKDTLEHFGKIFNDAWNDKDGKLIPAKMRQISQRIKHLFIMIDEITGDEGGAEFLQGITKIVNQYELPTYFNTKVIVADASIVDQEAILQHLNDASPEPDKIYFKKLTTPVEALQVDHFEFKKQKAVAINANSYPARSLDMTYKVFVQTVKLQENNPLGEKNDLVKLVQKEIIKDIRDRLSLPGVEQIIVYIQDKRRLAELIETIKAERAFKPNEDYLEINANVSDEEKDNIHKYKNKAKVIFMTASGSRGLSFPKTKHILVDIPKFQLEKNLMEVIQVIYRGRGEDERGKTFDNEDKELVFYLSDQVKYLEAKVESTPPFSSPREERNEMSLQESKLSLLNILLILKTSIMTRIMGYGYLGSDKFLIIPLGGKSVSAAGDTFTNQISHLLKELDSEYRRKKYNTVLRDVYNSLHNLFNRGEFILRPPEHQSQNLLPYLKLQQNFSKNFAEVCRNNLDKLLDYGNIEAGIIWGNLLVVPLGDQTLEEKYKQGLVDQINKYVNDELLDKMREIARNKKLYPENLRAAIKGGGIQLVKLLKKVDQDQSFEQESKRFDRYYVIPLFAFINNEELSHYWEGEPSEPDTAKFRDLLSTYARSIFPVSSVLPIGDRYQLFPFIILRSYSLEEMRQKMFTDNYLLTSKELNVLHLILSKSSHNASEDSGNY
ncbi:MAG: helicase [Microcoleaceae cyanobacterium]